MEQIQWELYNVRSAARPSATRRRRSWEVIRVARIDGWNVVQLRYSELVLLEEVLGSRWEQAESVLRRRMMIVMRCSVSRCLVAGGLAAGETSQAWSAAGWFLSLSPLLRVLETPSIHLLPSTARQTEIILSSMSLLTHQTKLSMSCTTSPARAPSWPRWRVKVVTRRWHLGTPIPGPWTVSQTRWDDDWV